MGCFRQPIFLEFSHTVAPAKGLLSFHLALGQEKLTGQQGLAAIAMHPPPHPRRQNIDIDFLSLTVLHKATLPFGKAAGPADGRPIGRPVTGPIKSTRVDETFHQPHRGAVNLQPIPLQDRQTFTQHRRRQIGHPHPGQEQKAHARDHMPKPERTLGGIPAQEAIPGAQVFYGGLPTHRPQPFASAAADQILQMGPHQARRTQVVMPADQLIPLPVLIHRGHPLPMQGSMGLQGPLQYRGQRKIRPRRTRGLDPSAPDRGPARGQTQSFLTFQFDQYRQCGTNFPSPAWAPPLPTLAQRQRQAHPAERWILPGQFPNTLHLSDRDIAPADNPR